MIDRDGICAYVNEIVDCVDQIDTHKRRKQELETAIAEYFTVTGENDIIVGEYVVSFSYPTPRARLDKEKIMEALGVDNLDDYMVEGTVTGATMVPSVKIKRDKRKVKVKWEKA